MAFNRVTMIVHDPAWDRVAYALSIATIALASGMECHALFTYGALKRLVEGKTDVLGPETSVAVRSELDRGLEKKSVIPLSRALKEARSFGLKIYACPAAMANLNISRDQLIAEVDKVMGLAAFLELARQSDLSYYI